MDVGFDEEAEVFIKIMIYHIFIYGISINFSISAISSAKSILYFKGSIEIV